MKEPGEDRQEELRHLNREVRTALGSVLGVSGMLAATPLDPDQTEHLDTLREAAERTLRLVEEVMQVSGLGTVEPNPGLRLCDVVQARNHREAGSPRRVLLVEDNAINRRVITRLLEKFGHSVAQAEDGEQAVEAAAREDFPVIFMDIQLPGIDGYEAIRRIRRNGRHQPWIVSLTASVLPEDRLASYAAGADDHVGKPVRAEELQAAIIRADRGERRAA